MGIEPTLFAWEARVLPLNDARVCDEATTAAVFDRPTVPGCELGLSYIMAVWPPFKIGAFGHFFASEFPRKQGFEDKPFFLFVRDTQITTA